jgi:hypothetical protein
MLTLKQAMKARGGGGADVRLYSSLNLGARWGGWSTPQLRRFTPGKDPILIAEEAGWAPGPVWKGAKNFAPTGIRSPEPSSS